MARYVEAVGTVETEREAWALPGSVRSLLLFCRRKPLGALGGFLVLVMLVMAVGAPLIARYAYDESIPGSRMKAPDCSSGWTDNLSATCGAGSSTARVSVTVGFITIALAILIATAVSVSSAYLGGVYDIAVQLVDAWMSFPYLVIILSIMAVLGRDCSLILSLSVLVARSSRGHPQGNAVGDAEPVHRVGARGRQRAPAHRLPLRPAQHRRDHYHPRHHRARRRQLAVRAVIPRPGRTAAPAVVGRHAGGLGPFLHAAGAQDSHRPQSPGCRRPQ